MLQEVNNLISISNEDIKQVESLLLPEHRFFSDEQYTIIKAMDTTNIVACPGSGKTTVLIAKIAIILKKLKESNSADGICIMTHTNVGVQEIKNKLFLLGIENIEYPNFIGTIHEFLNTYLAKKAYYEIYETDRRIVFYEEDEYKNIFSKVFDRYKPSWYNPSHSPPTSAIKQNNIFYDEDKKSVLIGYEKKSLDYQRSLYKTFALLLCNGVLRHIDTISLSEWYLTKNKKALQKAFANRFKYVFIDEMQDTSLDQFNIIDEIFKGDSIVQRFGDPYQALYNLFTHEEDAWIPEDANSIQLAESNRFGKTIAKVLQTTCIENYGILKGSNTVHSFKPHFIIYSDENIKTVFSVFANLISTLENENTEFKESKNKIYAVCRNHDELNKYHTEYEKGESVKKTLNIVNDARLILLDIVSNYLKKVGVRDNQSIQFSAKSLLEYIEKQSLADYEVLIENLAKWIKSLNAAEEMAFNNIQVVAQKYLGELIGKIWGLEVRLELLNKEVEDAGRRLLQVFSKQNTDSKELEKNIVNLYGKPIHINTVHGVKGETHKATLLLESSQFYESGSDLSNIFEFLIGDYDIDALMDSRTKDALKLAYVGLSRPTHLAVVAINKKNIDLLEQKITDIKQRGWEVVLI